MLLDVHPPSWFPRAGRYYCCPWGDITVAPSAWFLGDGEILLYVYPLSWFPGAGRGSLDVPLLPGSLGWGEVSGCAPPARFLKLNRDLIELLRRAEFQQRGSPHVHGRVGGPRDGRMVGGPRDGPLTLGSLGSPGIVP